MAYNLLDLRSRVRTKIKDTSYDASTIDGFIDDAQVEIADLYPWTYFKKKVDVTLSEDSETQDQQTDHQSTTRLILIDPDDSTKFFNLTKNYLEPDTFFERFPNPSSQGSSQPFFWTEFDNQIVFNCPVDDDYTLRQYYQKMPTELSGDSSIPELPRNFREALVLGAAYRCEEERQNYDIAAVLQNRFEDKVSDLIMRLANNTLVGPDTVILPSSEGE